VSSRPELPIDSILAEFSSRWERGESPSIEEYLARLGPAPTSDAAVLIYHAYCLAEATGLNPDPADFLKRFPAQGPSLEGLFRVHQALDAAELASGGVSGMLPEVGDEIGPYRLLRELGRGGLARVFLAEQADLDCRLVVVKVSTRITPEPRLLARARHSHIVEVLWHSLSDDGALQVVCMPFLGGATLADVLAERRRSGGRPRSGRDLLAELDRVAAAEYPRANLAQPARQIIARLSYPRAVAWIMARLAEALDYAYGRGVLHGDVKPSNILLTAAGEPMLLDFNLAVGWRSPTGDDLPEDAGGTLVYMPPERLRVVARPEQSAIPRAADRHRADVYALGMVLLEALAGRVPDQPRGAPRRTRETAAALAAARQQGVAALIGSCRVSIAPGLRSILARCLAPDPADRYTRAAELAEDLDRWCGDRPLAFAPELHWHDSVLRWARRRRLAVAAGVLSLVVAAVTTLMVWRASQASLRVQAQARLARLWDNTQSRVFGFATYGQWRNYRDRAEDAFHHLAYYNVLGRADWRSSDEFRALPESERAELEIWLLEQSFRLGRALGERKDSPDDWLRGLEALDRVVALRPLGPLLTQRRLLRHKLGLPDSTTANPPVAEANPAPRWMEEYLLGVEADPLYAERALNHYLNVLQERPESFWGHHRAAAMAYRLCDRAAAALHLEHCIRQRPENASLRVHLSNCLYGLERYDAALEQCNEALRLDPDLAVAYRLRTFIHDRLGQGEDAGTDMQRYELLTRHLGKIPGWRLRLDWMFDHAPDGTGSFDGYSNGLDLAQRLLTADPDNVDLRAVRARNHRTNGRPEAALAEYNTILEIDPDHLRARYGRGSLLYDRHRGEAVGDLSYLLEHPRFEELLRESSVWLEAFYYNSSELLQTGSTDKALAVAWRGLSYARRYGDRQLESRMHYALARAYATAAKSGPGTLEQAANHLHIAAQYNREYLGPEWFRDDRRFEGQRDAIAQLIAHHR
jgi:serine/threonine protein kinase